MKQAYSFLIFVLVSIQLQAQQGYFITIDADDNQFFSVTVGKKLYSSSAIGHLVISNLKDSTYKLAISFPGSSYGEQTFTIDLNKKDSRYQLKKNAEKAWSLQELQSHVSTKTEVAPPTTPKPVQDVPVKSGNAFAKMMAAVVNDTAVLTISPLKSETVKKPDEAKKQSELNTDTAKKVDLAASDKKTDTSKIVAAPVTKSSIDSSAKADKASATKSQPENSTVKNADPVHDKNIAAKAAAGTAVIAKPEKTSKIIKVNERWTKESRELVFIDSSNGSADTVRVLIALEQATEEKKEVVDTAVVKGKTNANVVDTAAVKIAPPVAPVINKTADTAVVRNEKKEIDSLAGKSAPAVSPEKKPIINSDCKSFATEADVDKLRIKMIGESNLDERILIAKKVFRTKCFTTRQIKALTELFVNDKTRYSFFDAAYPFVSDTSNFRQLVDLLSDVYYIDRFKVMVRM